MVVNDSRGTEAVDLDRVVITPVVQHDGIVAWRQLGAFPTDDAVHRRRDGDQPERRLSLAESGAEASFEAEHDADLPHHAPALIGTSQTQKAARRLPFP
jgi:hypothetical protein